MNCSGFLCQMVEDINLIIHTKNIGCGLSLYQYAVVSKYHHDSKGVLLVSVP